MSRLFVAFAFLFFSSPAFAHSAPECELLLLSPEQQSAAFFQELDSAIQTRPALSRAYLRLKGRLSRHRLLRECAQSGGCTNAQIAQAVAEVLATSSTRSDALGYGFLVGGMIANAAASAGITVWVNPQAEFFPTMVGFSLGQATFIAASLLSPFSEPISARIRRFSFALTGRGHPDSAQRASSELEAKADVTHATYTLREQYATDRIFVFRNALRLNFQTAALAMQNGNRDAVIAELADAAMAGYLYFKDIDPREPAIINAIYASFLIRVQDPQSLKEPVLSLLRERSPGFDAQAEAYYRNALDAWL